jgi:hypothetical protein
LPSIDHAPLKTNCAVNFAQIGEYPSIQFLASAGGSGINAQCVIVGNLTAN